MSRDKDTPERQDKKQRILPGEDKKEQERKEQPFKK